MTPFYFWSTWIFIESSISLGDYDLSSLKIGAGYLLKDGCSSDVLSLKEESY